MRRSATNCARKSHEADQWYEEKRPGLGEDFLKELESAYLRVEDHPHRYARLTVPSMKDREFRRLLLRRFPYKVIYEIRSEVVVVLAVAHGRRRPNYWLERTAH